MPNLFTRITKRLRSTSSSFFIDCHFSFILACLRFVDELGSRIHLRKIARWAHQRKNEWILAFLQKQLEPVLEDFSQKYNDGIPVHQAPIWVFWWSGFNSAPLIVKRCIQSTLKEAGRHPVHLLDKDSLNNFIKIPDYMLNKVQKGSIKLAHLADYIRIILLQKYGGLWLDATIFCTSPIPDDFFSLPFFTCKTNNGPDTYLSRMRWTTFVLSGYKGNLVFSFLKSALECYWKHNDYAVDYLFFDFLFELGYQNCKYFKELIDQVPENNLSRDDLQAAMNQALPAEAWSSIIKPDTVFYKLSWREQYSMTSCDDSLSIYNHFLKFHNGTKVNS